MYAIEMVLEKKANGTAVALQPEEPGAENQGSPMMFYFGDKPLASTDKPLEEMMPEETGPGLPECQGGAG